MPLHEGQIVPGAIVDHQYEIVDVSSGFTVQRPRVRRGIIERIDVNPETKGKEIYVRFAPEPADLEVIPNGELTLVRSSNPRVGPKKPEEHALYGEYDGRPKQAVKPVLEDALGLNQAGAAPPSEAF